MRSGAEPGYHAEDCSALGEAVVEHRKRELETICFLPDREHLVAGLAQKAPGPLGERLAAKGSERLRRAEAFGRAPDEEDPGDG